MHRSRGVKLVKEIQELKYKVLGEKSSSPAVTH